MSGNTRKVAGRRELHFESLDQLLAEAERLAAQPQLKLLGNWSLGQIFQHLAAALELALDGSDYRAPLLIRWVGPLLKRRMLSKGLAPGFQLPPGVQQLVPGETATEAGLAALRDAIARFKHDSPQPQHFVFGDMSPEDWIQLHLRHGELHLSFAVPGSP